MLLILIFTSCFFFCLPFIVFVIGSIIKNIKSYIKVSSLEGFHKNPSYILGHASLLSIALKIGLKGFEAGKAVSSAARTAPFKDVGYLAGWLGNLLYGLPVIVPTRVEVLKEVLGSKQFVHKSSLYYITKIAFGRGLLCSSRGTWTRHRKLLNPTFHQHLLQSYAPFMSQQSIKLVNDLKKTIEYQKTVEGESPYLINDFTYKLSPRIMTMLLEAIMGVEEGDLDPNFMNLAEEFDPVMCSRITQPWKIIKPIYELTKEGKGLINAMEFGHKEVRRIISKRIEDLSLNIDTENLGFQNPKSSNPESSNPESSNPESSNSDSDEEMKKEKKPTLVDALIEQHRSNPQSMPIEDIIDEVMNFLLAGWDTTTWTVSIILQLIGSMPEVQEKVYQEIVDTLTSSRGGATFNSRDLGEITMQESQKLKYMEAVIFETLRLYPLVNIHGRRLAEEMTCTIDGEKVTFPAGTEVVIDSELVHRSPRYWTDPNRFHPERFLPREGKNSQGISREDRNHNGNEGVRGKEKEVSDKTSNENVGVTGNGKGMMRECERVFKEQGKITPYSFIPFSAGPRNCIGKAYGILEVKVILCHLLTNFQITSVDPIDKIKFNFIGTVRRTRTPIKLLFEPRINPMEDIKCLSSETIKSETIKSETINSKSINCENNLNLTLTEIIQNERNTFKAG